MSTGHIDSADHYAVIGWAAEPDHPDVRLRLRIMVNGMEHSRVVADRPRPDLQRAGPYGDGAHGFACTFDPPLSPLHSYDVVVFCLDDNRELPHGRFRIEAIRAQDVTLRPLMVTATGRSGTTLLMQRLSSAADVVMAELFPFEVKLLTYYGYTLEILTTANSDTHGLSLDQITENPYQLGLNPFHHKNFEALYPNPAMLHRYFGPRTAARLYPTFRTIVDDFYRDMQSFFRKPSARYFAEKCDVFAPARNFARLAFDGPKELLLIRDPRDVYCSRRAFWSDSGEQAFQNLMSVRDRVMPILAEERASLLPVRYEDLVQKPVETMADIKEYLELSHMIELHPEREHQIFQSHATSADPAASIARWERELNADERTAFAKEFKQFFEAFGYETTTA